MRLSGLTVRQINHEANIDDGREDRRREPHKQRHDRAAKDCDAYLRVACGKQGGSRHQQSRPPTRAVQRSLLWWHGPGESEMPHTDANRPVIANWWFPRRGAI